MTMLGELIVRFAADVSGLSAGVTAAQNMMGSFSGSMGEADQASSSFFGNLRERWNTMHEGAARVGEFVASLQEMRFGWMQTIQGMIEADAQMEQTKIAFTTLLHSGQAADGFIKQLWNFAAQTPFQFQNIAQASQQMLAFGFNAKDIIPDLTTMGDALSAMGRTDAGSLQQIVYVFGQMHAAGKVNAGDMMQLTNLSIPGWKILADSMHMSVSEVRQLSQQGKLAADDAIPRLMKGLKDTFGGSMQAQAHTFNGLMTTVKDNLIGTWRIVSQPVFEAAKAGLEAFAAVVASPVFEHFGHIVGDIIAVPVKMLGFIFQSVAWLADVFQTQLKNNGAWLTQIGNIIRLTFVPAFDIAKKIFTGFSDLLGSFGGGVATPFGDVIRSGIGTALAFISPIVLAVGNTFLNLAHAVGDNMPYLKDFAQLILVSIVEAFKTVGKAISEVVDAFSGVADAISPVGMQFKLDLPAIRDFAYWLSDGITTAAKNMAAGIRAAAPTLKEIAEFLGGVAVTGAKVFGEVMSWLGPVIKQVAGIVGGELSANIKFAVTWIAQIAKWVKTDLYPAFLSILPSIMSFGKIIVTEVVPALAKIWAAGQQVARALLPILIQAFEILAPILVKVGGFLINQLGQALHFIMPYLVKAAEAVAKFAQEFAVRAAPIMKWLGENLPKVLAQLWAIWEPIWNDIKGLIGQVWGFVADTIRIAWDLVSGIILVGLDVLSGNWGQAWTDIQNMFGDIWSTIGDLIQRWWGVITGIISTGIDVIKSFFVGLWNDLVGHSIVPDIINGILDWFGKIGTEVAQAVQAGLSVITGFFNDFLSGVGQFGANIISGIISGIQGALGNLGATMNNVMSFIGSFLPHSPAKRGELANLPLYGPALVKGVASGILSSVYLLAPAMAALSGGMAVTGAVRLGTTNAAILPIGTGQRIPYAAANTPGGGQPIVVQVNMDSKQLAEYVGRAQSTIIQLRTGTRQW